MIVELDMGFTSPPCLLCIALGPFSGKISTCRTPAQPWKARITIRTQPRKKHSELYDIGLLYSSSLPQPPSFERTMDLLDLPPELFEAIITETVFLVGLRPAVKLRLVSSKLK